MKVATFTLMLRHGAGYSTRDGWYCGRPTTEYPDTPFWGLIYTLGEGDDKSVEEHLDEMVELATKEGFTRENGWDIVREVL